MGFYLFDQRLLFQAFFNAAKNVAIGRARVLCDYGLFPDVRTFNVSAACLRSQRNEPHEEAMVVASSGQDEALLKESWSANLFEKRAASSGVSRVSALRRSKSSRRSVCQR